MSIPPPTISQLAVALEIPDCGCPDRFRKICACHHECDCPRFPGEPCIHIRAANHDFSIDAWIALLLTVNRRAFALRPAPRRCSAVLSRQARVAIYQERRAAGLSLFHQADAWQGQPASDSEEELQVETLGERLRNGRSNPTEHGTWEDDDE